MEKSRNLEELLRSNSLIEGEFRLHRFGIDEFDNVHIYIHPSGTDGETLDFIVKENSLFTKHLK